MALTLSSLEQKQLGACLRSILSPLDPGDVDAWRTDFTRQTKQLLGADMGGFLLPVDGRARFFNQDLSDVAAQEYPRRAPRIPGMMCMWERQLFLGVFNRAMMFEGYLEEYYRSEYHNEYVARNHAFDSLGLSVSLNGSRGAGSIAGLLFHHESAQSPPFGQRGLDLLRLIYPAFQAGVRTWHTFARRRAELQRLIDAQGDACALWDHGGRALHLTPALLTLLQDDPEEGGVIACARSLALSLVRLHEEQMDREAGCGGIRPQEIETVRRRYRVEGCLVAGELCGGKAAVLTTFRTSPTDRMRPRDLQSRYGLTARQAEVALLLSDGLPNSAVARRLFISPHTARRHTEQVLLKLGAGSRAEVGAVLRARD